MESSARSLITVALPAEARPLVDHYKLKPVDPAPFRCWADSSVFLVETGIGKLNAAAGTSFALTTSRANCCINVGIAGCDREVGTLVAAHRISDRSGNRHWYPQQSWNSKLPTVDVHTVEQPDDHYLPDIAFDMEASGVMVAALKYLPSDLIQSLKIISDNADQPFHALDRKSVSELIASQSESISMAIDRVMELHRKSADSGLVEGMMETLTSDQTSLQQFQLHLTKSQLHDLKRLLQRQLALTGELPELSFFKSARNSKELLNELRNNVDAIQQTY